MNSVQKRARERRENKTCRVRCIISRSNGTSATLKKARTTGKCVQRICATTGIESPATSSTRLRWGAKKNKQNNKYAVKYPNNTGATNRKQQYSYKKKIKKLKKKSLEKKSIENFFFKKITK